MPEPEGIPCPICREPLAEGAEACGNCGAGVSETALRNLTRALGIDSAKAQELLRKGVRSPDDLGGRSIGEVLNEKEPSVLYLCPECGAFVSSADKTCGKCGARLAEEAMDLDKFLEAGAPVGERGGGEPGSPGAAASSPPASPDSEMQAIERLLEEGPDDTEVAAGLDALANEVEAEEAVLELEGP